MNNFPFFQHQVVKIIFDKTIIIDEALVDKISSLLTSKFIFNIVSQGKHEFSNNGLTKFWILSQSHMVIHTWPENNAIHIDLMTCRKSLVTSKMIKSCLLGLGIRNIVVIELTY